MVSRKNIERALKHLKELIDTDKSDKMIDFLLSELKNLEEELFTNTVIPVERGYPLPDEFKKHQSEKKAVLFSDGACRGNPGPGSWAAVAQDKEDEFLFCASGVEMLTTNNKMELEGVIKGLDQLRDANKYDYVLVYSDSKYVIEGVDKWLPSWKKRGWKKSDNKPPENLELWKNLDSLRESFPQVSFRWVKGHSGHPQNEYCDQLANQVLDESGF